MTETNNPNNHNNEGALTRARSARLGITPTAHATEEQQPPVQVIAHPAQDDENTRSGTETPSTITGNGGDLMDTSSRDGNPIKVRGETVNATADHQDPSTTDTSSYVQVENNGGNEEEIIKALKNVEDAFDKEIQDISEQGEAKQHGGDEESMATTAAKEEIEALKMQMTAIQANQEADSATMKTGFEAMMTMKVGFEAMMTMMMENQKTMFDKFEAKIETIEASQKTFEATIEEKIATEFQTSSAKWMSDQHLIIDKKMDEAKEQMKEYATSFLNELIESEMGKAKEGHETLIKKSFDHQLELEQLRNECNDAIKKMNKFKMKHGNDTKEAMELVMQSAEKEKKVKDFEQEIVELRLNLEKMEKRLTDVMGEKGSVNNIEANFNAMNASYEQQKQHLDKFEAKLDNVENNTLRKVETIAQQCGETYQKVITANKAIEQDVEALRAIHKAGAKQEETLKVIQKEMKSMLEMLKEFREIKSETMAASLMVQEVQPIAKKLEEAMRKMNHIQSYEELEKEVKTIKTVISELEKGAQPSGKKGGRWPTSAGCSRAEVEAIVKKYCTPEQTRIMLEKEGAYQAETIFNKSKGWMDEFDRKGKSWNEEFQNAREDAVKLIGMETDDAIKLISNKAQQSHSETIKTVTESRQEAIQTLTTTMDLLKEEADAMIEPMLEVKTDFAAKIKEMEQLITRNTLLNTMESNSRAEFRQSMENLKNAVADMVKQIPTQVSPTESSEVGETTEQRAPETTTSPTKSGIQKEQEMGRIDGYMWPPTGAKALAEDERERSNLKEKDWIWSRRFYNVKDAIKWLNDESEDGDQTEILSSEKDKDDDDSQESHKKNGEDDSNYKDHDPRSSKYNGQFERNKKNKHQRQQDDFPHVEHGNYSGWHGYHDDNSELDIERLMAEQYDRDQHGMDYYQSMGDEKCRDRRRTYQDEEINRENYTTGNWVREQNYRIRNGTYRGSPREEWQEQFNYQQYDEDRERDMGFDFGQEYWDRSRGNGTGRSNSRQSPQRSHQRHSPQSRQSPRSPSYLRYAQDEMAMTYFMGEQGREYLQVSDFQLLGFLHPEASHQVIFPLHSKFMKNYENTSPYGYKRGPDVKSLMASTTLKALNDTEQEAVIEWYEFTAQQLETYGIQLTPFDEIELMYGPYAFCIPGIGIEKYNEIGRILAQIMMTTLLPMKTNSNDSELSQLLAIEAAKSRTNGFDLLDVVMKHCVKAFDANEVEIEWPKYSQTNNVFKFGERMLLTAKLAAKRGQVYNDRTVAMTFLNSITREAGSGYRFAAMMKRNELDAYPRNRPLGTKFSMMKMAKEISDAGKETNRESSTLDKALYKVNQPSINNTFIQTSPPPNQATQTNFQDDVYINPENGTHLNGVLQGATRDSYWINEMYRPKRGFKPRNKPVPDPAKDSGKKKKSLFDASIICNACHMIGHPACRCHTLAAAVWVMKFLEDTNNEEECKKALEHWDSRNRGMLRDPKTNKVCEQSAFQVLRTYADRYGHSLEAIDNGLDWAYFEDENGFDPQACMNAFGLQWPHHSEQHSE
jgi:hypothetical protein